MDYNQPNLIVSDILTEAEIAMVYSHIERTPEDKTFVEPFFGHRAYFSWLPDAVVAKLTAMAQTTTDKKLELRELSFARYESSLKPMLHPHLDKVFYEPRLTFDVQVGGNVKWPIIVEGREYTLENNQALTFSGTHQIHWRPKQEFVEGDYLDMIFCHFSEVGATPNSLGDEHYLPLLARCDKILEEYYNES